MVFIYRPRWDSRCNKMPEPIQTSEEDVEIYEMDDSPDYMKELSDLVNSKPKE